MVKIYSDGIAALEGLEDGMTVLFGGFGLCGIPETLIESIKRKGTKNITAVSNDAGAHNFGIGALVNSHQITKLYSSYVGENPDVNKLLSAGEIELHLIPQGTLAEKVRCGGSGIPAFFTPTGCNTVVEEGKLPVKYSKNGTISKYSGPKDVKIFPDGKKYLLEHSITGDFALIKAWKADRQGNLIFHSTARNFNPDMAKAARITVAEVEEILDCGSLKPDEIHLPSLYVNRLILGGRYENRVEKMMLRSHPWTLKPEPDEAYVTTKDSWRNNVARRAAKELKEGMYVNLGIGKQQRMCHNIPIG